MKNFTSTYSFDLLTVFQFHVLTRFITPYVNFGTTPCEKFHFITKFLAP